VALYAGFVLSEIGQRLENLALNGAALQSAAAREASLGRLSLVSVVSFGAVLVLVVMAGAISRRLGYGTLVAASLGAAVLLVDLLKDWLARPELVAGPAWLLRNSFPSGTAAIGAAIGLALLLLSPERLRWFALPVGALVAAILGQATQVAGWHRMSDALAGVLVAMAVMLGGLVVLVLRGLVQPSSHGRVSVGVHRAVAGVGLGLIALGAVILAIATLFPVLRAPVGADSAFLHTTFDLIGAGATLIAFVGFSVVIEPYGLGASQPDGRGPSEPDELPA